MQLPFSYKVRRSHRAKYVRIVVSAAKVEVVAPLLTAESVIKGFVYDKRNWIALTLNRLQSSGQGVTGLAPPRYCDGAEIPFQGAKHRMRIQPHGFKSTKITFDEEFTAFVPEIVKEDPHETIRSALIKWMKQRARLEAELTVRDHVALHQLQPRSIRIKTQKSRWGSCGINNDIHLNWVLMLAPRTVFEYVVVHELCHIRHRNHSSDFWRLVAEHLPDYRRQREWLKQNGAGLMLGL